MRDRRYSGALILADQAASSLTNFAANLVGLALLTRGGYGDLSLALATYYFLMALMRSYSLDPMLLAAASDSQATALGRRLAVRCGMSFGAFVAVVGLALRRYELLVLGCALPAVFGVEFIRARAFQQRDPLRALFADVAWGLFLVAGYVAIRLFDLQLGPSAVIAMWAVPAAILGGVALLRPHGPLPASSLVSAARKVGLTYALELVARVGGLYLIVVLVGLYLGNAELGFYSGARTFFGPITAGLLAFNSYFIPKHAPMSSSARKVFRSGLLASAIFGLGAFAIALFARHAPVMEIVTRVGDSGAEIAPLLWPMGVFVAVQASTYPARSVLRRLRKESLAAVLQAINSVALLCAAFATLALQPGVELIWVIWPMVSVAGAFWFVWWAYAWSASRTKVEMGNE